NLYTEYPIFIVRAGSPLADAAALERRLKADIKGLRVALATAIGNTNHIALAQVARHAGCDPRALTIDVFDSARYAIAHVVEGGAELGVITAVSAVPELTSGALSALMISERRRLQDRHVARRHRPGRHRAGGDGVLARGAETGDRDRTVARRARQEILGEHLHDRRCARRVSRGGARDHVRRSRRAWPAARRVAGIRVSVTRAGAPATRASRKRRPAPARRGSDRRDAV